MGTKRGTSTSNSSVPVRAVPTSAIDRSPGSPGVLAVTDRPSDPGALLIGLAPPGRPSRSEMP